MNFKCSYFSFAVNQFRKIGTSNACLKDKNHYNSLGLSPKATQADVKAAYYKLSMMYHPDKNKGNDEDSEKFRDISNAYEVLGNVKMRKLYDRGLFIGNSTFETTTDDDINKFYKSRETRSRPPPPTGRTPIYDFDEWSRNHYGATFARDMKNKQRNEFFRRKREQDASDIKTEKMLFGLGFLVLICMLIFSEVHSNDDVRYVGGGSIPIAAPKNVAKNDKD